MKSQRLPGKSLKRLHGRPLIYWVLTRLKQVSFPHKLILATSLEKEDDPLALMGKEEGVIVVRGNEQDVLSRYKLASDLSGAEVIVRITGDCPLIDPKVVDKVVGAFISAHPSVDYASNTIQRTFPRGLDVEVLTRRALELAAKSAESIEEKEHVTLYFHRHSKLFSMLNVENDQNFSNYRLTVDTPEDFLLMEKIYDYAEATPEFLDLAKIVRILETHPQLALINKDIQQKMP